MNRWNKYILWLALNFAVVFVVELQSTMAQEADLAWEAVGYFKYNIEQTKFDPLSRQVKIIFSVTDPTKTHGSADSDGTKLWDIKNDLHFKTAATLRADIGWNTIDVTNAGSNGTGILERIWLNPISPPTAVGAAYPIQINLLTGSRACTGNGLGSDCEGVGDPLYRFYAYSKALPPQATGTGIAAIEGHPSGWPITVNGTTVLANVPVKSEFTIFAINGTPSARRQVVDINKCKVCHDNRTHGDSFVPRLSLHGANRNEEIGVCVVCHNPSQTDIPWRASGTEESVDLKRMVHGIHAGKRRDNPLVIVGFRGTVVDFSQVVFPSELKNCLNCHIETNGKGTFELPLPSGALGSTVMTQSKLASEVPPYGYVDLDPLNDVKITPTAATCSGCHDDAETRQHMVRRGGASFASTFQPNTGKWLGAERCVSCHGPGKDRDVRKVHGLGGPQSDDD